MRDRFRSLVSLLLVAATFLTACAPSGSGPVEKTLYVGPYQVDCTGVAPQKCLLVKEDPRKDWRSFYDPIEGFAYEPGFQYELVVIEEKVENPPADASDAKWTLNKIVSKKRALEGTTWMLESYRNSEGRVVDVLAGSTVTAVFQEGQLGGNASCNAYGATYSVEGGRLTVDVGAMTMMMCVPDELAQQEQAYINNLGSASFHLVLQDELRIADTSGQTVLQYRVQKATPFARYQVAVDGV